ncbi:hypothetical protein TNCV_2708891 [Trichonephila clavipes]|nr:hypothetical protein TNCV_2708891 [Trichonephila clavipes]
MVKTEVYNSTAKNKLSFSTIMVKLQHFAPILLFLKARFPNEMVDAAAKWYRYRIVACLVTSSNPVPLKTRRVGSDASKICRELKRPPIGVVW